MSRSIRVSDVLMAEAEQSAALFHRSPPQQIEHWAEIGRVMESALSWKAQQRVKAAGLKKEVETALAAVNTPAGRLRARAVIRASSVKPVSNDRRA